MAFSALIAGASGMVGLHVLDLLLQDPDYDKVTSIGRRALSLSNEKLDQVVVDFDNLQDHAVLFGATHVYCCLGTTIKKAGSKEAFRKVDQVFPLRMAALAESENALCFSIITAYGSDSGSMFFYSRVKGDVEEALGDLNIPSISILQPSLLLGERNEERLGERISQAAMKATGGLMVGPLKKFKAIEGVQVARAMVAVTKEGRKGLIRYPNDELLEF